MGPIGRVEAIAPERGDFNWRDYYIDALRAFDEALIHRRSVTGAAPPCAEPRAIHPPAELTVARFYGSRSNRRFRSDAPSRLVDEPASGQGCGGRKLQDQLDCVKSLAIRTQTVHVLAARMIC